MTPCTLKTIAKHQGFLEGTPEALQLAQKQGTPYCNLTGLLQFVFQIGHVDIKDPVMILSKFNTLPAAAHYTSACAVIKYLCCTNKLGPIFW